MARARGVDPLAVSLYEGPSKPLESADWVEPILTDHLFFATPRSVNVRVEVVDRFGRVFSESI